MGSRIDGTVCFASILMLSLIRLDRGTALWRTPTVAADDTPLPTLALVLKLHKPLVCLHGGEQPSLRRHVASCPRVNELSLGFVRILSMRPVDGHSYLFFGWEFVGVVCCYRGFVLAFVLLGIVVILVLVLSRSGTLSNQVSLLAAVVALHVGLSPSVVVAADTTSAEAAATSPQAWSTALSDSGGVGSV